MPTPFMHLHLSEELRTLAEQSDLSGPWLETLSTEWPAFLLGAVAADYQTICGVRRSDTHFYSMPPHSRMEGVRNMLARYPHLYPGKALDADQAAFVAAYLVHLKLDLDWHFDVILPAFANNDLIDDLRHGYLLHVILLTYLDDLAYHTLPASVFTELAEAHYHDWLPFADIGQIYKWHNYLLRQMAPGAETQTVPIFAGRLGMTPQEFAAKLNDPGWMKGEFFSRIPVSKIQRQLMESLTSCLDMVDDYWHGRFEQDKT